MSDCETDTDEDCYRIGSCMGDSDQSDSASENYDRCGDVVDDESLEIYFAKLFRLRLAVFSFAEKRQVCLVRN